MKQDKQIEKNLFAKGVLFYITLFVLLGIIALLIVTFYNSFFSDVWGIIAIIGILCDVYALVGLIKLHEKNKKE